MKQRVVGAAVLVALGVIFIPLFLDNGNLTTDVPDVADLPPPPADDFSSRVVPLDEAEIETLDARTALTLPPSIVDETPVDQTVDMSAAAAEPATDISSPAAPVEPTPQPAPPTTSPNPPPEIAEIVPPRESVEAWTVQLGSFSNDKNAKNLIDKLRKADYPAYLERRLDGEKTAFKVRVGPQIQRREAEQVRDRLERQFKLKGLLLRYR